MSVDEEILQTIDESLDKNGTLELVAELLAELDGADFDEAFHYVIKSVCVDREKAFRLLSDSDSQLAFGELMGDTMRTAETIPEYPLKNVEFFPNPERAAKASSMLAQFKAEKQERKQIRIRLKNILQLLRRAIMTHYGSG